MTEPSEPMAWLLLVSAGLLEVVFAVALKNADGFTRLWPSIIGVSAAWVSFGLLTVALRSLPVGTAYAVWTGIGIIGVAAVGIVAQGESSSLGRLTSLALILTGIIGLRLLD